MAEIMVSTAIVGLMVVAALNAAGMSVKTQRLNVDKLTGPGLAQDLMTEILSMPYADPQSPAAAIGVDTGESSASRSTFDDVDDYHSLSSSDFKARDGTVRSGYTGWSQAVTVAYADVATGVASGSTDTGLKRVTVTVTSSAGTATQLVGLRFKEGPLEQTLPILGTAVSWVGAELRVGSSTRSQFAAAPLVNLTTDAN